MRSLSDGAAFLLLKYDFVERNIACSVIGWKCVLERMSQLWGELTGLPHVLLLLVLVWGADVGKKALSWSLVEIITLDWHLLPLLHFLWNWHGVRMAWFTWLVDDGSSWRIFSWGNTVGSIAVSIVLSQVNSWNVLVWIIIIILAVGLIVATAGKAVNSKVFARVFELRISGALIELHHLLLEHWNNLTAILLMEFIIATLTTLVLVDLHDLSLLLHCSVGGWVESSLDVGAYISNRVDSLMIDHASGGLVQLLWVDRVLHWKAHCTLTLSLCKLLF